MSFLGTTNTQSQFQLRPTSRDRPCECD